MSSGEAGRARIRAPVTEKLKRTFYLDRESVVALSELQAKEFRLTGRKPDLSELVSRGIRMLGKKH